MPKMKTDRGAAKRIKVTGTGRLRRRKAFRGHTAREQEQRPHAAARTREATSPRRTSDATRRMLGI